MAADSTMLRTMKRFTALSLGTSAPLDSQNTRLTCTVESGGVSGLRVWPAGGGGGRQGSRALQAPGEMGGMPLEAGGDSGAARSHNTRTAHSRALALHRARTCPRAPAGLLRPLLRRFLDMMEKAGPP